ncbi:hypothetical protein X831_gp140 [Pseudomonas phage PAK_P2]|uniref:Uncharacterized protein n=5 Tax=Pakpunavirus TaxID=1921407 RepID=A0AAE8YNW4_9CAUD|nr:hypothetical protein X831_gp140 [Pseudomonas phage PAK_P2]YP_008859350.1 hypothetical protein PAK_P400139 [Pseudomonas phage PAK_P4]YP_010761965.1 hypothetical protein QE322_gp015 [Pseudomonas phage PaGz-1]YP_010765077.1 hypothetical protein QE346_gp033 [Pseudomonas phage phipa10]YP_010765450.1 hypothetical protein QE348_gp154 [Pseudomonas phage vB_Paer_PsIn]WQZ01204.1 hypothetical protein [Pseudomonas phage Pae01]AGR89260.1 hypothetical protein PAK_P200139c [Pseudomonas phage PAK_P2]AGR8
MSIDLDNLTAYELLYLQAQIIEKLRLKFEESGEGELEIKDVYRGMLLTMGSDGYTIPRGCECKVVSIDHEDNFYPVLVEYTNQEGDYRHHWITYGELGQMVRR